jgi:putative MATE family efflux protein
MASTQARASTATHERLRDTERRLLEGRVAPTLVVFSIPLLATNFVGALSGTWITIWVGQSLGPNGLTAVVNANLFMGMMTGAIMGVGSAAGIAIGQSIGLGHRDSTKRITGNAISFVMATSALIGVAGFFYAPQLLDLIRMPASARDDAITYLRVTCLSMPPVFAYAFLMMMLRGAGDARTPFRFSLITIGLSVILSPLLLMGGYGFPRLGIAGAAVGSLIANTVALGSLVVYLYIRDHPLALRRGDFHHLIPDLALIGMLVRRGLPMAGETFIVQGAYFVLLTLVNGHGAATAAAYAAAAQLWWYVQMPSGAVAASMSSMAAMTIGAGQWDRVNRIAWQGCAISMGATLVAAAVVYALGDLPLRLFLPHAGESLAIAHHINMIVLWGWTMLAITNGLSAMVRANSAMLAPTLIYAATMWAMRVPFAVGLTGLLGADAVWWSFPVGTIGSALLALAYYRWGGWRKNKLMVTPYTANTGRTADTLAPDPLGDPLN